MKIQNQKPETRNQYGWTLAASAALALVAGALLPPFVGEGLRLLVREAFAPVCHQMPARSFHVGGVALAVCHRCFGIYTGVLAGTLAWPLGRRRFGAWIGRHAGPLVVAAGLPAAVDWALGVSGLWANTTLSQAATGALLGLAMGLLFARAAAQALARQRPPAPAEADR